MVYEVNNTFEGGTLHRASEITTVASPTVRKITLCVSVFRGQGHYEFKISEPAKKITSVIDYYVGEKFSLELYSKDFEVNSQAVVYVKCCCESFFVRKAIR